MIYRQASLSRNIVQFCRFLRQQGFNVSTEEETTTLRSLQFIDYNNKEIFSRALKAVLCRSRSQLEQFDALFTEYWKELGKALDSKVKTRTNPTIKPGTNEASFKALKFWLNGNKESEIESTASYSIHQNLSNRDFSNVPALELPEMIRTLKALSKRLAAQTNKRYQQSEKISQPDLRRTLRKNMRFGGELLQIAFKKPKHNRLKLVVLCDLSKSMELYAAFLLQFIYSFSQVYSRIETFAFSTSLHSISNVLKQNDFSSALQALSAQNFNFNGGTKIGESLHAFVVDFAARLLNKRTIVIILSDGWDTGDTSLIGQSLEIIHTKAKKVIWLNPLAGYAGYRPDVAGMKEALPFIDVLAPVHNLESLRKLSKWL
ncbi:vWA domain-containing protein [Adhaeribacter radiodurans]|uniref:VWA domain-containing protein n=1 Tax=Adhaeribacter radiodurans TaxID=2745197 RepID=A0A7L7L906_9BACT|nr:VWA domain-containing protein [Adhaeribacter radiodurans]QMU29298.1 VWA domain-containing protein [Adhaeribacter radiodurans]